VVIPTTAGTGSEASPDAGIHPNPKTISSGITSSHVVPRVAVCDPELTFTLPPRLTAATGLDALSHCIEGYSAKTVSPLADALALDGVRRICHFLPEATLNGTDRAARWQVMMAAFEGGVAIGKGLGPAHAIAISCGDQGLHHGLLSAIGLVASMRLMSEHAPERVADIAAAMGLSADKSVADAVLELMLQLGLPGSLRDMGYVPRDFKRLARAASENHFNLTSPYAPNEVEFAQLLSEVLG
jgi:4-hydroxybutyrate dehydrogenase